MKPHGESGSHWQPCTNSQFARASSTHMACCCPYRWHTSNSPAMWRRHGGGTCTSCSCVSMLLQPAVVPLLIRAASCSHTIPCVHCVQFVYCVYDGSGSRLCIVPVCLLHSTSVLASLVPPRCKLCIRCPACGRHLGESFSWRHPLCTV